MGSGEGYMKRMYIQRVTMSPKIEKGQKREKADKRPKKKERMAGEEWVSKNPPRDRKGCRLQTTVLHGRLVHNGPLPFELTIHSPFSRAHEPQTHTAVQEVAPP